MEPFFKVVHGGVESGKVLVDEKGVGGQVELSPSVVVALVVALSWKVQPLRVAKLVA